MRVRGGVRLNGKGHESTNVYKKELKLLNKLNVTRYHHRRISRNIIYIKYLV